MTQARWIIEGRLKVASPLSIRTGYEEAKFPAPLGGKEEWEIEPNLPSLPATDGEKPPVAGIELDHKSKPFVPASAMKGLIRALAASSLTETDSEAVFSLLGDRPKQGRNSDDTSLEDDALIAKGGSAEIRNAMIDYDPNDPFRPAVRGRTALHEGSRTAEDGQLRQDRIVAPGTTFKVQIILSRVDQGAVSLLLGLLALIDGRDASSAVGAGVTQGDGRVIWQQDKVRISVFGPDEARDWLGHPGKPWVDCAREIAVPPQPLSVSHTHRATLDFAIDIAGSFLVGAQEKAPDSKNTNATRTRPLRIHKDDDTTARLPGSSLDGALRAQARRIFRTISGDFAPWAEDDTDLPDALERLFGSAKRGSLLECEEFSATGLTPIKQEFVALDRLSGGGADEKKFDLTGFQAPRLKGKLHVVLHRSVTTDLTGKADMSPGVSITPEAIGLLALALKDLACGDVPLGRGTRKGYGGVRSLIYRNGGWEDLLAHLGDEVLKVLPLVLALKPLQGCADGREVITRSVDCLHTQAATWRAKAAAKEQVSK